MKKILLATTLLAAGATASFADVTLSGDGRMGIKNNGTDTTFSSRARVSFTLAGTSDSGLTFGGSFRADQAPTGGAVDGKAGSVFVSGAFGKLSMGSVVGAAEAAVGDVGTADVGYTGLIAQNDGAFITGDSNYTTALYEYAVGDATFYLSGGDSGHAEDAIGLSYKVGGYTLGLGYENNYWDYPGVGVATSFSVAGDLGPVAAKALYLVRDEGKQIGLSGTYTADALSVTATWVNIVGSGETDIGLGAAYALGGGLTLAGGYASNDGTDVYDLGLKFKF